MQIVQIIPSMNAGGAERTVVDVSNAIMAAGGRSLVLSRMGRLVHELKASGGQFQELPVDSKNPWRMWQNITRITNAAQPFGGQILHARSRAPAWSARCAAKRLGVPFVTTYHGVYTSNSTLKTRYNSIMAAGDLVIANSKFVAAHIEKTHGTDKTRIRVIPPGMDMQALDPKNIDPLRLEKLASRLNLHLGANTPVLVMPGRLTRLKGHLVMIEAMAMLRDQGHDMVLLMPGQPKGTPDYQMELTTKINKNGLDSHIHFAGHVTDMAALYALSTIVISASIQPEAFGRVAVEGQAAGRPVIATAHGGSLETIQPDIGGLLVRPNDAGAMAEAIVKLLTLPAQTRTNWGRAGQNWVREQFSLQRMCNATLAVYQELLDPYQ